MYFDTRPRWGRVPFDTIARSPWLEVPFDKSEYEQRWSRIARRLTERGLEALVVHGRPGDCAAVRWLTNFESYVGNTFAVILRDGSCHLATNSLMRAEPMQSGIWMTHVEDIRVTSPKRYSPDARSLDSLVADILADAGITTGAIGVVSEKPDTGGAHDQTDFAEDLASICAIKSPAEIDILRKANNIASNVFRQVRAATAPGVRENQLAGVAFRAMMEMSAEGVSFPLALVGGKRSGLKHVPPGDYQLCDGDILFMDFGLSYHGYVTDNARTAIVGTPTKETRDFVETADAMSRASIAAARPGVAQSTVEQVAFDTAAARGFEQDYYFRAHGVGTALFGHPRFHPGSGNALKPGQVFSLEPMLVRHGFGSACVERTILITNSGTEVLDKDEGIWIEG